MSCRHFDVGTARPGSAYALSASAAEAAWTATVPTLEEVVALAKARPRFQLFVELKCDASEDSADPVALADAAYDVIAAGTFWTMSIFVGFDWRALARIRAARSGRRLLVHHRQTVRRCAAGDRHHRRGGRARAGFPTCRTPRRRISPMRAPRGLKVGAWTVNDPPTCAG